jgi:catechol 2,3-dioxygenase-like lactoylglutathione lyase family enzyme
MEKTNVQPHHDRQQRYCPVKEVLRCPLYRNGRSTCYTGREGPTGLLAQWQPFHGHQPIDGKPASQANGGTIGFVMKDAAQAEAWHKAGVANGGTSIEDPPGKRPNGAYLAYLRDPDGHKLVGVAR